MKELDIILNNKTVFLKHMKSKFTMIHQSNFFYRDFQYGVLSFLSDHGMRTSREKANIIAREVIVEFEKQGILKKIDYQTWMLFYPEFTLPRIEKKAS